MSETLSIDDIKYFVHGILFSVIGIALVILWTAFLKALVMLSFIIGLIGLVALFFIMGGLNSFLTSMIWEIDINTDWKALILHGLVLSILMFIVANLSLLINSLAPSIGTILALFVAYGLLDGYVAKKVACRFRKGEIVQRILTIDDYNFEGKTALVRVDFNSPIDPNTKRVLDSTRIKVHGESTIKELSAKGAKVVILAHQGRPGDPDFTSLREHAKILGTILGKPVQFVDDLFGEKAQNAIQRLKDGEILVLDNVRRFADEQKKGTPEEHAKTELVKKLAPLADVFVNDAFAAAHRAHVSIVGFTAVLPSVAGRIMEREVTALNKVVHNPEKPCVYALAGAKADDALKISKYVLDNGIADHILTGGVVANLFLVARGFDVGKPNMERLEKMDAMQFVPGIKELTAKYPGIIEVPSDLAVDAKGKRVEVPVSKLPTDYVLCDIGHETVKAYTGILKGAKSIVLSGPMGVFENKAFIYGTAEILRTVASSKAFSLVGGGHSIAAVEELGLSKKISYISTAGGALIEFLMGEKLPGIVALEKAATRA